MRGGSGAEQRFLQLRPGQVAASLRLAAGLRVALPLGTRRRLTRGADR